MLTRDSVKCDNELRSVIKCHGGETPLLPEERWLFFFFIHMRLCFIKDHEHPEHLTPPLFQMAV